MKAALVLALLGAGMGARTFDGEATGPPTKKAGKAKSDAEAILGDWEVASIEMEGKKQVGGAAARIMAKTWTFTAKSLVIHKGKEERESGSVLHPGRKPKAIDVVPRDGPPAEKGTRFEQVYALDGDTLKICAGLPGNTARPKEVATKPGSRTLLIVLRRLSPSSADKDKGKGKEP